MSHRNEYMKEYMKKRYHTRREYGIKKLGGCCSNCGSVDSLEFDHIDPTTKKYTIAKAWTFSSKRFEEELTKCQLLCRSCHQKKSLKDAGQKDARSTHGTLSSYRYCRCDLCTKAKSDYNKKSRANSSVGSSRKLLTSRS